MNPAISAIIREARIDDEVDIAVIQEVFHRENLTKPAHVARLTERAFLEMGLPGCYFEDITLAAQTIVDQERRAAHESIRQATATEVLQQPMVNATTHGVLPNFASHDHQETVAHQARNQPPTRPHRVSFQGDPRGTENQRAPPLLPPSQAGRARVSLEEDPRNNNRLRHDLASNHASPHDPPANNHNSAKNVLEMQNDGSNDVSPQKRAPPQQSSHGDNPQTSSREETHSLLPSQDQLQNNQTQSQGPHQSAGEVVLQTRLLSRLVAALSRLVAALEKADPVAQNPVAQNPAAQNRSEPNRTTVVHHVAQRSGSVSRRSSNNNNPTDSNCETSAQDRLQRLDNLLEERGGEDEDASDDEVDNRLLRIAKTKEVAFLEARLKQKDVRIQEQNKRIHKQDKRIAEQDARIAEQDKHIQELESWTGITAMSSSSSTTSPSTSAVANAAASNVAVTTSIPPNGASSTTSTATGAATAATAAANSRSTSVARKKRKLKK